LLPPPIFFKGNIIVRIIISPKYWNLGCTIAYLNLIVGSLGHFLHVYNLFELPNNYNPIISYNRFLFYTSCNVFFVCKISPKNFNQFLKGIFCCKKISEKNYIYILFLFLFFIFYFFCHIWTLILVYF